MRIYTRRPPRGHIIQCYRHRQSSNVCVCVNISVNSASYVRECVCVCVRYKKGRRTSGPSRASVSAMCVRLRGLRHDRWQVAPVKIPFRRSVPHLPPPPASQNATAPPAEHAHHTALPQLRHRPRLPTPRSKHFHFNRLSFPPFMCSTTAADPFAAAAAAAPYTLSLARNPPPTQ